MNSFILLKTSLSLYFVIPLVFVIGVYFSVKLRFLQFTKMGYVIKSLLKSAKTKKKGVSSFSALAAVLGGNLGTGNIAGIAFGLTIGGPGSLFWMWVMALLGSILKYIGCFLGVKYRQKDLKLEGGYVGGPMYYLANGLNSKFLSKLFCVFCILGAFSVGNLVQVNSISLPLISAGINPWISGIFMAATVGLVLLRGKKAFLNFSSKVVPVMAAVYLVACLIILMLNLEKLLPALTLIFTYALNPSAVGGGIGAYMIFDAVRVGFDRGLFATDAGIGLAPIVHAEVTSHDKIEKLAFTQGMIGIFAPIIVMVICSITGLTLLVTGVWQDSSLESTNMCIRAFQLGLSNNFAGNIVTITLWFFAFTTILTWAHCSEKAYNFLFPRASTFAYRLLFILIVPFGVMASVSFVWLMADIVINLMLLLNLIGVVGLANKVIKDTRNLLDN